ncbi:MAG: hypothetical protein Q7U38_08715 [Methylobacter sp.]|nr:hypothetical protein [Methylobacter sp.]MDP2427337.1 hypothetical protein [Methylobacter sp.]MDP3054201.1 hypothetical protein [Methylobacter sp.]MDP3361611.1 hypothetical protein [Methylobacter sp.]MDZ4217833.1 hypothetical protein [Methylobacter sp.]
MKFVVCMENTTLGDFSTDDLTIGRLYEVTGDIDLHGMLRIIDDSGEDYLYPARLFEQLSVPDTTAKRLHYILKQ